MTPRRPGHLSPLPLFSDRERDRLAETLRAMAAEYDEVTRAVGITGWIDLQTRRRAERNAVLRARRMGRQLRGDAKTGADRHAFSEAHLGGAA